MIFNNFGAFLEVPGDTIVAMQELFIGDVNEETIRKTELDYWPFQQISVIPVKDVHDKVFFWRKKRTRDVAQLCTADVNTGHVRVILTEESKPYLNEELFGCRIENKGKDIFLWSDRSGWGHYYRYNGEG